MSIFLICFLGFVFILLSVLVLCGYTSLSIDPVRPAGKHRLACVGDSITYGCTLPFFFLHRYPSVLQKMLGPEICVRTFGVNDRTLQNSGNKPYRKESAFRQSKDFLPDTVVILLGTNDSKDYNWISPDLFRQQYAELISEYRSLSSSPRILICTPPCAFPPDSPVFSVTNDTKIDRISEIADSVRAVAESEHTDLVDLHVLTDGRRELFGPDGLHPNAVGAAAIAGEVFRVLQSDRYESGQKLT